jgi:NitT/TauT family transport system permease protein
MNAISNGSLEQVATPENQRVPSVAAARRRRLILVNGLRILFVFVIVGGWEIGSRVGAIDPFFWGQPSGIWLQLVKWTTQGTAQGPLWEQIAVTLEETVLGFLIGVVLGVAFGIVLGVNRFLADVLGPYIKAANSIPRVVLGSIFVIGLGLGIQSKVALAVVLVFFIVFFNAFQGVREVDRNLLANARILGASQWQIASSVKGTFNANGVFAAMVILAVMALISDALVTTLENQLLRWRPKTVSDATI